MDHDDTGDQLPQGYALPPYNTIPALIDWAAAQFGDAEALVQGDLRWNWHEVRAEIHRVAVALAGRGVTLGDRVGIWAPNIWEFVTAALGAHAAGASLVPVNTRFKGAEAADVLSRSNAKVLFTVTDFLGVDYIDALQTCEAGVPDALEALVVLRGTVPEGAVGYADFVAEAGAAAPDQTVAVTDVGGDDLCHIMFTSGTTGSPKGAMLTHRAVTRAYRDWADIVGLREGDRYLIINPFFHSFGLNAGVLACFIKGATIIPETVFDVPAVMARVAEEKVSMLPGPPTLYQTILMHPDVADHDLGSLRLAVTGAAAIPVEMIGEIKAKLGFENIVTGYGLTEASGMGTMSRFDDPAEIIVNTCGRAIPGLTVRIVGPDGGEVPRGEAGEIVIKGYSVMRGYLDDPEKTAETIDANGWLHTGDIGVMDAVGNVKITDRLKDMFIVGGFNAYPAEIENTMSSHPAIGQVAVVGVPADRQGEVGYAFIVMAPDQTMPTDEELTAWCRERMANYKVPRTFAAIDALPLNASGKVLKNDLRALAQAAD